MTIDRRAREVTELVTSLLPGIERQLLRYRLAAWDREDVRQRVLLQIARKLPSFRGDASVSTWVFRVTMNEVLMHLRSRRRRNARIVSGVSPDVLEEIGPLTEAAPWEHRAATRQRDTRVRAAIRALPEEWRSVVEAYYDEDLPLHDVAARLSLSESAARTRLHRARRLLRTQLDGDGWAREARSELAEPRRRAA